MGGGRAIKITADPQNEMFPGTKTPSGPLVTSWETKKLADVLGCLDCYIEVLKASRLGL